MRIGELATRTALPPDTIRFYERAGVLEAPPRTTGGYREYDERAVVDLEFVKKAQRSGLTLRQVREVLEIASSGRPPCEHVRATVHERLAEVESRLQDLRALRNALRGTLWRLDAALKPKAGCRCPVIEAE